MNSPRFAPAGLLVVAPRGHGHAPIRIGFDGGGSSDPGGPLDAWLVTDDRAELIGAIRRRGRELSTTPVVGPFAEGDLKIRPRPVRHTSHPTFAYELRWCGRRVVWAPEFWRVPAWVAGADLFFADAAGWSRPIPFAGGVGGHAAALAVAERARALVVKRLVFAHIGRPTIRAMDAGQRPPFGDFGRDGQTFRMTPGARRLRGIPAPGGRGPSVRIVR